MISSVSGFKISLAVLACAFGVPSFFVLWICFLTEKLVTCDCLPAIVNCHGCVFVYFLVCWYCNRIPSYSLDFLTMQAQLRSVESTVSWKADQSAACHTMRSPSADFSIGLSIFSKVPLIFRDVLSAISKKFPSWPAALSCNVVCCNVCSSRQSLMCPRATQQISRQRGSPPFWQSISEVTRIPLVNRLCPSEMSIFL